METIGRPRIGERIAVRLPDDLLAELDARAEAAGVTRAEAVRVLLRRALAMGNVGGVDRTQIAHRLALSPAERVGTMADEVRRLLALRERSGG
jgi:hypothetical protein